MRSGAEPSRSLQVTEATRASASGVTLQRYPARHGIPRGTVSHVARYVAPQDGIPRDTVSYSGTVSHSGTVSYSGTVSHSGTVSDAARYPA